MNEPFWLTALKACAIFAGFYFFVVVIFGSTP
jgi:hypothetical protein